MIFSRNSMVDLEGKWEYKCKHYIFSPVTELLNLKQLNLINILWPGLYHQNWWTSVSILICHWYRFLKFYNTEWKQINIGLFLYMYYLLHTRVNISVFLTFSYTKVQTTTIFSMILIRFNLYNISFSKLYLKSTTTTNT